jgi:hypothetical protein
LTEKLVKNAYLKEPSGFMEWTDRNIIDLYTAAEYIRPWQVNGKYSESAAYYLNMESSIRLGNYLIDRKIDKIKNSFFIFLARLRNRLMFYKVPFDKDLYKKFLTNFYKRRQDLEKSGQYSLSKLEAKAKKV